MKREKQSHVLKVKKGFEGSEYHWDLQYELTLACKQQPGNLASIMLLSFVWTSLTDPTINVKI